jgi:hypothetical protein
MKKIFALVFVMVMVMLFASSGYAYTPMSLYYELFENYEISPLDFLYCTKGVSTEDVDGVVVDGVVVRNQLEELKIITYIYPDATEEEMYKYVEDLETYTGYEIIESPGEIDNIEEFPLVHLRSKNNRSDMWTIYVPKDSGQDEYGVAVCVKINF